MAIILGFKKSKEWELFEMEIDKAVKTFTSLELKDLIKKDEASFEKLINESTSLKSDQIKILADLLYERSFVSGNNGDTGEMINLLKKANYLFTLFSDTLTANDYNVEVRYRMELIRKIIDADA
jgi:hypothetical protein